MNDQDQYYSSDELIMLVRKLQDGEKKRLLACAHRLAEICWCDNHEELLQEAIVRVLDGRRKKCPRSVNFVTFMFGVMKSVASEWKGKAYREVCSLDGGDRTEIEAAKTCNDDNLRQKQIKVFSDNLFEEATEMLSNDKNAIFIIQADVDGSLTANEIRQKLGIDKKQYDSLRKRIRRTFNILKSKHQGRYNDVI